MGEFIYSWLRHSYNHSCVLCSLQEFYGLCEPIRNLKYCGNTTDLFKHLQTFHPSIYSLIKKASQASQEEKAKSSASGSSSHHSKKITECFVAHEKYNSDRPCAKVLTKAVGYCVAKD